MKNIIITGIPRSVKTTLSKLIKEKYPEYNIISFEAIRNGFIQSQPGLKMGNRNSEARKEILPDFIMEFVHWNNIISKYPCVIEGDFADLKTINDLSNEDDLIICLGLGCKTIDEIVNLIKENDTKDDYTYDWAEDKLKEHFYDIEEKDKENYNYCKEKNIKYYDTSKNRKKLLEDVTNNMV